ncbi:MAG: hypothetical protein JO072_01070 [Parafilimonas sp.]|nr:hypothetical protein [Parafilimonas sp.]
MKPTILYLIFSLGILNSNNAQPATLDTSFGDKGKILISTSTYVQTPAYAVLQTPQGKILTGGGKNLSFLLIQFLQDGSLNESFGNGGIDTTFFKGCC